MLRDVGATADFGTSTITGKKRDSLRKSSGMPEAGTEASFSSRKRIAFALSSGLGCAKGEIADVITVVIEIPVYYLYFPALAGRQVGIGKKQEWIEVGENSPTCLGLSIRDDPRRQQQRFSLKAGYIVKI